MVRRGLLRRAAGWLLVVAGAYSAVVYAAARVDWVTMAEGTPPATLPPAPAARAAGAIHVHTRRSYDAVGSEAELARAARAAGLDFVFVTDHRDAGSPPAEWERIARREEGVLLVRGQEIRVEGVGKVLVDRLDTAVVAWTGGAESFLARVERDSAFTVVAHPRGRPSDRWRPVAAPGMAAWEVFDFTDVARRRLADPTVAYHLVALLGGELAGRAEHNWLRLYRHGFRAPGVAAFDSLWARAGRERPPAPPRALSTGAPGPVAATQVDPAVPGAPGSGPAGRPGPTAVGGLDVHPKARLPGGRLFPGYASSLRTIVNHVALEAAPDPDPVVAARALGAAIRRGDVFVSFGDAAGARGFRVGVVAPAGGGVAPPETPGARVAASSPNGSHTAPGGATPMAAGLRLEAGFATDPGRVAYRVVRDGREVGWWRGAGLSRALEGPGAYRVEVFRYSARLGGLVWNLRPWIFVNPVLVEPSAGGC